MDLNNARAPNRSRRKLFFVVFLCTILVLSFSADYYIRVQGQVQKTVYVVVNVETAPPEAESYIGASDTHPSMDVSAFAPGSGSAVAQAMDTTFRNSIQDSFGNSFKITWLCEMDYLMYQSGFFFKNGTAGVIGYTAMYDLMKEEWGTQIQNYGDFLEYYHHFETYNGTWNLYNNGPDAAYGDYQNIALDHMIIDDSYYPTVFWSQYYRNVVPIAESNWVEQYIPFEYTPTFGGTTPYHLYSGMNHWQVETLEYYDSDNLLEAYNNAVNYGSSIYSIYLTPTSNIEGNITAIQNQCVAYSNNHAVFPGVVFKYVTAAQAMQLALGYTDTTPPTFTVTRNSSTYVITSSKPLWGNSPYVALEYSGGTYSEGVPEPVGTNTWTVTVPNSGSLVKIGVAASDLYGNPGVLTFSPLTPPTSSIPAAPSLPPSAPPEVQVPIHGVTASSMYNLTYNPGKAINGIESPTNYWAS